MPLGNPVTLYDASGNAISGPFGVAGPNQGLVVAGLDAGNLVRALGTDTAGYAITDPEGSNYVDDAVTALLGGITVALPTHVVAGGGEVSSTYLFPTLALGAANGGVSPIGPGVPDLSYIILGISNLGVGTISGGGGNIAFTDTVNTQVWTLTAPLPAYNIATNTVGRIIVPIMPGHVLKNATLTLTYTSINAGSIGVWAILVSSRTPFYRYSHLAANATTVIKSGVGLLHAVAINTLGNVDTITLYDNTAGSGAVIAIINSAVSQGALLYDVTFAVGLTAVIAGTTAPDITVSYL